MSGQIGELSQIADPQANVKSERKPRGVLDELENAYPVGPRLSSEGPILVPGGSCARWWGVENLSGDCQGRISVPS